MSTTQHPTQIHAQHARRVRCLRHHVSMAACEDCRSARKALIEQERRVRRVGGPALL